jgi:hypothetical protein
LPKPTRSKVKAARQIIEGLGLEVATPDEAREILKLKGREAREFLKSSRRRPGSNQSSSLIE